MAAVAMAAVAMAAVGVRSTESGRAISAQVRTPLPGPVFLGVGDSGECFMRMLENWLCHFDRLQISSFLFMALDDEVHRFMVERHRPSVRLRWEDHRRIGVYGSASYRSATLSKVHAAEAVLQLGYDIIFVDIDVALLLDPRPLLLGLSRGRNVDLLFTLNFPHSDLNTGLYYARSTPSTLKLFKAWRQQAAKRPGIDQDVLNFFLHTHCGSNSGYLITHMRFNLSHVVNVSSCGTFPLRLESLPVSLFRSGQRSVRTMFAGTPIAWHANFMVGGQRKQHFLLTTPGAWCAANRTLCPRPWDKPSAGV